MDEIVETRRCPICDLAVLEEKPAIEFRLTLPYDILHCDICGASYIVREDDQLYRIQAAEGIAEE